jgi:mannose-6-phosphate isomerase-like protein (cupin superfamily)
MPAPISPASIAAALTEYWSPRVIGEVDDVYVKVAKVLGTFGWHSHDDEDELFFILDGRLCIAFEHAAAVELEAGQMHVVPKGLRHNPVAAQECLLMLIERKSTRHSGNAVTARTRSIEQQLGSE